MSENSPEKPFLSYEAGSLSFGARESEALSAHEADDAWSLNARDALNFPDQFRENCDEELCENPRAGGRETQLLRELGAMRVLSLLIQAVVAAFSLPAPGTAAAGTVSPRTRHAPDFADVTPALSDVSPHFPLTSPPLSSSHAASSPRCVSDISPR